MAYSNGKSRFWLSYTGGRGSSQGHGILSGDPVHTRGWDAGVKVTARGSRISRDEFNIHMTTGSHESGRDVQLGTVSDTPDGPRWTPAGPPAVIPVAAGTVPVIAAIPVNSHLNRATPAEYACVVLAGRWPSGESRFGTARITRGEAGEWTVTEHSDYWDAPMSQTQAVTAMVEMTGHSRPACTKPHATR